MKHRYLLLFFVLMLLASCSKEVARITLNEQVTEGRCEFRLAEKQAIELWTDLDIQYTEPFSLVYAITMLKDGKIVYEKYCDCFDVDRELFSVKKQINAKHSVKYQGRLNCTIPKADKGTYTLTVQSLLKGSEYKLKKVDIVIKK